MNVLRAALVSFTLAASPALAQDTDEGGETFLRYCSTCHGVEAKGGGPMAPILTLQPPNLTQLTTQNGGVFPTSWVVARIDGRDPFLAHGSPMPIYGDFFEGKGETIRGEDGVMIMTSQPVIDLVAFLKMIQE